MKNLTQQIKTTLLLSVLVLLAITVKAQNNYFIKMDGTKAELHGEEIFDDGKTIAYRDKDNKHKNESIKNIKIMVLGGSILINIPINPKRNFRSLQYIVAFNDKYVLVGKEYSFGVVLNILDRQFNFVNTDKIEMSYSNSGFSNRDKKISDINKKTYQEQVIKYFKDCPTLNEAILKNLDNNDVFYSSINYYNCNNSLDLFTNKPVESSEVNTNTNKEVENKDFYVTKNGEKVDIDGSAILALDENFKYKKAKYVGTYLGNEKVLTKDIKYLIHSDKVFFPMKYGATENLLDIVAFNDSYILACHYKDNPYGMNKLSDVADIICVYDRKTNSILDKAEIKKTDIMFIQKYFGDNKDLIAAFDSNLKNHRNLLFGISYINSNNSKELIEGIKFE